MANLKEAFGAATAFTCTFSTLTSSATVGRASTSVDNTTNLMLDAMVDINIVYPNLAPANDKGIYLFAYGSLDGTNYPEGVTGTDASYTFAAVSVLRMIGFCPAVQNTTRRYGPFNIAPAFDGIMPAKWGIIVLNFSGQTLTTGGSVQYREVYATVV